MPYTPTTWQDEVPGSSPIKYKVTDDTLGIVAPSAKIEVLTSVTPGTPMNASNLNKLEAGVQTAQAAAEAAQASANDYIAAIVALVSRVANQSIVTSTYTAVSHDTAAKNPQGLWSAGSPTLITVARAGYYSIGANLEYAANNTGNRETRLVVNGSGYVVKHNCVGMSGDTTAVVLNSIEYLTAGQNISVVAWQSSGGNLNLTGRLWAIFIGT